MSWKPVVLQKVLNSAKIKACLCIYHVWGTFGAMNEQQVLHIK